MSLNKKIKMQMVSVLKVSAGVVGVVWAVLAAAGVWLVNGLMRKRFKHIREPDMKLFSTVPCAARYDFVDWQPLELYLGAVF